MKLIRTAKANVSYTAIMSPESIANGKVTPWSELVNNMNIPDGWKIHAHHLTMFMGDGNGKAKSILGNTVQLQIVGIGKDENVMALLVNTPVPTTNQKPHITIATAPGIKPYQSNQLKTWNPLQEDSRIPKTIAGIIAEVDNQGNIINEEVEEEFGLEEPQELCNKDLPK